MLFEVLKLIVKKKKKKKKKKKCPGLFTNGCYHMVQQSTHSALGACIYLLTNLGLSTLLVLSFSKQVGVKILAIIVSPHCPPRLTAPTSISYAKLVALGSVTYCMVSQRYPRHPRPCSISGIEFILRLF